MILYKTVIRRTNTIVTLVLAASLFNNARSVVAQTEYAVGVAAVDITPAYPIRLNGFGGRRTESEGITQRIWAKALAIGSDEEKPLVLITVDSLGLRLSMVEEVAERLKKKAGIERERLAVTFTHSHTTPKVNGACDTIFSTPIPPDHQAHIDQYTKELTDSLEKVALAALSSRQPARLDWAVGNVGFAKNRRTPNGPVNHDLPVLVVRSTKDNSVQAIYVNYACHCVTLSNNKISGDWAGFAQDLMQRKHPGAVALVSIGCGSDSNPDSGVTGDNTAAAVDQGSQIADEVERLLKGRLKSINGKTAATLRHIELPLQTPPTKDELKKLAANDDPVGFNAKVQLERLERGEKLQSAIDYPIQTWSFGDSFAMVFLSGEVCVDYSLRLQQELDSSRVWINGYSNDFCCYVPSERLLAEGGYGGGAEVVYFALPAMLHPGLEEKIIAEVHAQLPAPFQRKTKPTPQSSLRPTPPAQALESIQAREDCTVELMASEPLVESPVAIDFGPDGRLWVAEMTDYSRDVDAKFEQTGCVKVLVDRDGDGKFDDATVFESGLRFPTDVKVWHKGVIVCDAPNVIYLEDTDGDGHADVRKTLLTGFATHNAQARVNSLRWGIDNWVYGSCGLFGGYVRSFSGQEIDLGGRDFRFHPDTGEVEAVTGKTQQGRARDDFGNWFGCENGALCKHYPLSDHYLARNPHISPPATEVSVPAGSEPNRLFTKGRPVLFEQSGAPGVPTSACGLDIYRDELLGPGFRGNAFTAEPVNQLVHRLVLSPRGVTFEGVRADDESHSEFLASADNWFRPVQIRTGLDGCLWIVDMSRYVIEHPRFIPAEILKKLDPMAGRNAGRIYRVRPKDQAPRAVVRLDQLDTAGLVSAIDSPNGPQRDLVQQILIERGDHTAAAGLTPLVKEAKRPETRLQALCTLAGLGELQDDIVLCALKDSNAGVRRHAVRLSESLLGKSPAIGDELAALAGDPDPQVQLQLAYTLGQWGDARAPKILSDLAWKHHDDPYLLTAVLSSVTRQNAAEVTRFLLSEHSPQELPTTLRNAVIVVATKVGDETCLRNTFAALCPKDDTRISASQLNTVADFLGALSAEQRTKFFLQSNPKSTPLSRAVASARSLVQESNTDQDTTMAALRILSFAAPDDKEVLKSVGNLLTPHSPPQVQEAAIEVLSTRDGATAGDILLTNWGSYTPKLQSRVLDVCFGREELIQLLLARIERGDIKPSQINASQRQRLLTHSNPEVRSAAARAFAGAINSNRQSVIDSYASVEHTPGDAAHGRDLFRKNCSGCHRLEDVGSKVGPDLAALTSHAPAVLLEAVFDPSRKIDAQYRSYLAITDDGRTYTGILKSETSTSVTLVEQQSKEQTLLRNTLDEFKDSGKSLMPDGFEKDLSVADTADLFAYLVTQSTPPKKVPGNLPAIVTPASDGRIRLLASNAEIYGDTITFEPTFRNIGYWNEVGDHVAWNVAAPKRGIYEVYFDLACIDQAAGNVAAVEGFAEPLQVTISGTGGWEAYRTTLVGQVELPAGRNRIVVRPVAASLIGGALMDLRGVDLVPLEKSTRAAKDGNGRHKTQDPAAAVAELTKGLALGTKEESDRIPSIWNVAIAAGLRNQPQEVTRLLELSIPSSGKTLDRWRVVVIGGGIVNGLSQRGIWPRTRIAELLRTNPDLQKDWTSMIDRAAKMADDEAVPSGIRYDALRILGTDTFDRSGPILVKYLAKDIDSELQLGSVCALTDIEDNAVSEAIISNFSHLSCKAEATRGLLRTQAGVNALLDAVEGERISASSLSSESITELQRSESSETRSRAKTLFGADNTTASPK